MLQLQKTLLMNKRLSFRQRSRGESYLCFFTWGIIQLISKLFIENAKKVTKLWYNFIRKTRSLKCGKYIHKSSFSESAFLTRELPRSKMKVVQLLPIKMFKYHCHRFQGSIFIVLHRSKSSFRGKVRCHQIVNFCTAGFILYWE